MSLLNPVRLHNILTGKVILRGKWVNMEVKHAEYTRRERLINEGYVEFNGKWITIDEKMAAHFNPTPKVTVKKKDFGPMES